jgi:polar amino acid transport system substrate-binding protein
MNSKYVSAVQARHFLFSLLLLVMAACSQDTPPAAPQKPPEVKPAAQTAPAPGPSLRNSLERIKETGELRVGMQVGYVPFQMLGPNGALVGFDVEAAELIARNLKVSLRIVQSDWNELIPALAAGNIDIIMSAMAITPERNLKVLFTIPVVETGRMFAVHVSNNEKFKQFKDLDGPGIFIVSGPQGIGELKPQELIPRASFRSFPEQAKAANEVAERRAHALVDDEFAVRRVCSERPGTLTSRFEPITYEMIAWAVHPRDVHFLNWLNNFITQIQGDGRLDELKKKWLHDYFLDRKGVR